MDGSVQLRLEYLLGDQPNKPRVVQLVLMSNRLPKIHRLGAGRIVGVRCAMASAKSVSG